MLTPDQIAAAQKANLDTLFGLMRKTIEGVEKLAELNMSTARLTLGDAAKHAQATLSAKDAQELLALQAAMLQPLVEKTAAYTQQLYHLASESNAEMTRTIEAQAAEMQRAVAALMDAGLQNAPAGSEMAVAALRNSLSAANETLEAMHKAFRQAGAMAEQNFKSAAAQAMKAATPVHAAAPSAASKPAATAGARKRR